MEANRSLELGAVTALLCGAAAAAAVPAGRVTPSGFFIAAELLVALAAAGFELSMLDDPGPVAVLAGCAVTTTGRCCAAWMRDSDALAGTAASSSSSRSSQPSTSSSAAPSASASARGSLEREARGETPLKGGEEYLEAEEKASSSGSERVRGRGRGIGRRGRGGGGGKEKTKSRAETGEMEITGKRYEDGYH